MHDWLQDLCENHFTVRAMLQMAEGEERSWDWQRMVDNLGSLRPETVDTILRQSR
jgi:hypothetical protein